MTVPHTYLVTGLFTVTLTVTDLEMLADNGSTTAQIDSFYMARAFTLGGNNTTSLGAGKPYTCLQVEPVGGAYANGNIDLSSIKMISLGTGSVSQIFADASKTTIEGDKDHNGVAEITACFSKTDLRLLFGSLSPGRNMVTVQIVGNLIAGGTFKASLNMTVKSTGGALAMSISPNPLNPRAKVSFETSELGAFRVQMFDPQGRLVRTIAEERGAKAGSHDFAIDGVSSNGSKLASGIYFVKVWSEHDGVEVQTITFLK